MSVNLNEFERNHLELLIALVEEKLDDLNWKLQQLEDLPEGDVRHDLYVPIISEFDAFLLWKVQLENALNEVKEIEKEMSH